MQPEPAEPRLWDILQKSKARQPLTPEERAYRTNRYAKYKDCRITIHSPRHAAEWKRKADAKSMSHSEWAEGRILDAERGQNQELEDLRRENARKDIQIDAQRVQFSDLALEHAKEKERQRVFEQDLNARLGELLRQRGDA